MNKNEDGRDGNTERMGSTKKNYYSKLQTELVVRQIDQLGIHFYWGGMIWMQLSKRKV